MGFKRMKAEVRKRANDLMSDRYRVSLSARYVREIRGHGLASGESPITLAAWFLRQHHGTRPKHQGESDSAYLDAHKAVMQKFTRTAEAKEKRRKLKKAREDAKRRKTPDAQFLASKEFLNTYEWRKLRMQVLVKFGPRCMCCGATPEEDGAMICVDHIKPRLTHPELALDFDNLQILCEECNHGKGNWDTTDWREKWKV